MLALTVEQRAMFAGEVRTLWQVWFLGLSYAYLVGGMYVALRTLAACDPNAHCDATSARWVVRGLVAGFASLVIAALLSAKTSAASSDKSEPAAPDAAAN